MAKSEDPNRVILKLALNMANETDKRAVSTKHKMAVSPDAD